MYLLAQALDGMLEHVDLKALLAPVEEYSWESTLFEDVVGQLHSILNIGMHELGRQVCPAAQGTGAAGRRGNVTGWMMVELCTQHMHAAAPPLMVRLSALGLRGLPADQLITITSCAPHPQPLYTQSIPHPFSQASTLQCHKMIPLVAPCDPAASIIPSRFRYPQAARNGAC